jgi:hypothetical protein
MMDQPMGLIMPTELGVVSEVKAQAQTQTLITIVLDGVIITLVMLVLLFADQSFSKATIELMCLF